jgi:hypothetical protein
MPVALAALGYAGAEGWVLFREDTALFDTGVAGAGYAHGGNSPQERIIPVLTLSRRRDPAAARTSYAIAATVLPPALGHARVRLRLEVAAGQNESHGFVAPSCIALALRAAGRDDAVRVLVKEAQGAELDGGRILLAPGPGEVEIFFALQGPRDERVQVEVFHPDGIEAVTPQMLDGWFDVAGAAGLPPGTASPAATASAPAGGDWAAAIPDQGARQVFLHLAEHTVITEEEIVRLLGSPRAARRFAATFDGHLRLVPFLVRIEATEGGKRYVKEREL